MRKKNIISVVLSVLLSVVFVAVAANAATTISTNIDTGGTLTITGLTALNGNASTTMFSSTGNVWVNGYATTTASNGNFATQGTLTVTGASTLSSTLDVTATTTLNGYSVVAPTRRTADAYAYGFDINTDTFFTGIAAKKSYLLSVRGDRTASYAATGDSNDALVKVAGNNYAYNDGNFILRGINTGINNRSGGYLGTLEGASIGAQNKSGGYASTTNALTVTAENYGSVTDRFGGIDILLKNEGAVATTEYGLRIRNENNSLATEVDAGIILSDTGANNGWTYGIDLNGATIGTADIRLKNGETIDNVTDGTIALTGALTVTATSTLSLGLTLNKPVACVNLYATSTATRGSLVFVTTGATSTYAGTVYWQYGACN